MPVSLALADLTPFAPDLDASKANLMIADALALAEEAAPCIGAEDLDPKKAAAAKAILRGAILRWNESGQGGRSQVTDIVGPFQHAEAFDTTKPRRSLFWPSEIVQLQKICTDEAASRKAWGYDTAGGNGPLHADICAINLGASYCSCGTVYNGGAGPLWEDPEA
jgi:hypothetical protein